MLPPNLMEVAEQLAHQFGFHGRRSVILFTLLAIALVLAIYSLTRQILYVVGLHRKQP